MCPCIYIIHVLYYTVDNYVKWLTILLGYLQMSISYTQQYMIMRCGIIAYAVPVIFNGLVFHGWKLGRIYFRNFIFDVFSEGEGGVFY